MCFASCDIIEYWVVLETTWWPHDSAGAAPTYVDPCHAEFSLGNIKNNLYLYHFSIIKMAQVEIFPMDDNDVAVSA